MNRFVNLQDKLVSPSTRLILFLVPLLLELPVEPVLLAPVLLLQLDLLLPVLKTRMMTTDLIRCGLIGHISRLSARLACGNDDSITFNYVLSFEAIKRARLIIALIAQDRRLMNPSFPRDCDVCYE